MNIIHATILILLCAAMAPSARAQNTIYVSADATGAADGSSWHDAFVSLQDALAAANTGDQIWVAGGIYRPDEGSGHTPGERSSTFEIRSGVALYGGFAGTETNVQDRVLGVHDTILSGDIGTADESSDNAMHVLTSVGADGSAILDGFVVAGGNADGADDDGYGGGLFNDGGAPSIINVRFLGNRATNGGAVYSREGSPSLVNSVFSGNRADSGGGAIFNDRSSTTITNVTISSNTASRAPAIYNLDSSPSVANSIVWGNFPTGGDPNSRLDCERNAFPCSWAEVDSSIFDRSDQLADEILLMLDSGASVADALVWIRGQSDVVHSLASEAAVVFRVEGGRPTWVLSADAILIPEAGSGKRDVSFTPEIVADVVGDEPKSKRALVLSPYQFDPNIAALDPSTSLASMLGSTRSYEGQVDYFANTQSEAGVFAEHFGNWDDYDVVHVITHGTQVCKGEDCRTVMMFGPTRRRFILNSTETGVDLVKIEFGKYNHGVGTDFFRRKYPNGLPDAIVYVSACKTSKGDDLIEALTGGGGVYVGWDESVWVDTASKAALAFFEQLITKGIPTESAFGELLEGENLTLDRMNRNGAFAQLSVVRSSGDDLRIRETVFLQHPLTKKDLPSSVAYPVVGQPEDGTPDKIPYLVKVDGVEGREGEFTVHVTANGFSADPKVLSEGEMLDGEGNVWQLKGEVAVPFDAQKGQEVDLAVRVELPEGGETRWSETVQLGNPVLVFTSEFESTEAPGRIFSDVKAEFDLSFDHVEETFKGQGTLEYLEYTVEPAPDGCTLTTTTTDGTLRILEMVFPSGETEIPVPDEVSLMSVGVSDSYTVTCPEVTIPVPTSYWETSFIEWHSGAISCAPEDEYDETRPAVVMEMFEAGTGEVIARKAYDRSCQEGDVLYREKTIVELRSPASGS